MENVIQKKYKIDWLAFTVFFREDEEENQDLLHKLKFNLSEFEQVNGKNFYNSGYTLHNYVNIYYNSKEKILHANSSDTMLFVFTGQGATELALRWNSDWVSIFKLLKNCYKINFTRIDIALDDFSHSVSFDDIEEKLSKGHYKSSKRSFNIVKSSDINQAKLGRTIYIGNHRSDNGNKGNIYARFYDKRAQYLAKNQILPDEAVNSWQRYEIAYSKQYANAIVEKFIAGESVDIIFKSSLRNLLELLSPKGKDKNKNRWYKAKFWEDFLNFDEKIEFKFPERDVMLGDLLEWLRKSVLPSLALLEEIGEERGFDIYSLLKQAQKTKEFSKKQQRLKANSMMLDDDIINIYLDKFIKGKPINE